MRKILIVRFGGMGDILMTTPAVRTLAEQWAPCQIDYLVGRGNRASLEGIPYIHEIIEWGPRGKGAKVPDLLKLTGELRDRHYDLFVNFQPSAKTLTMMIGSGAKKWIVFRKDRRQLRATGRTQHAIDDFNKDLAGIGITVPSRRMDFAVPDSARQALNELLQAQGIAPNDLLIVANPGGTREVNRWPLDCYVELFNRLAQEMPRARLLLSGGPYDKERANYIASHVAPETGLVNLAGQLNLKETAALLERTSVFVTPDTGPMHVASALGTPLVALSGAADPDRTGPLNPHDLVVIRRDLSCVSCGARTCRRGDIACMTGMSVDWVIGAIRHRLGTIPLPMIGVEEVSETGLHPLVRQNDRATAKV